MPQNLTKGSLTVTRSTALAPPHDRAQASLLIVAIGSLVLLAVLIYSNTFQSPFVFDDLTEIEENAAIQQLWPPSVPMLGGKLPSRPVPYYTFALNYQISGLNVWSYHAVNILIHVTCALLLLGIVRRTLKLPGTPDHLRKHALLIAWTVAALWVAHPLHTQAVTYIYQRMESLMGLCYLLTLYCFLRGVDASRPVGWWLGSWIACGIGMACKEVMVTAPLVVVWFDIVFVRESWHVSLRKRWWYYLGLASTWIILYLVVLSQSDRYIEFDRPKWTRWEYLFNQAPVLLRYLALSAWPTRQCLDYGWTAAEVSPLFIAQVLIVVAAVGAVALLAMRRPRLGLIAATFFVILGPTSSLLPLNDLMMEHRMYLPLIPIILLVVLGAHEIWRRWLSREETPEFNVRCWVGAVVSVVCLWGLLTYLRNDDYSSRVRLWSSATTLAPANPRAWCNLGTAYAVEADFELAAKCQREALRLDPESLEARLNLGGLLAKQGAYDEALFHLTQAVASAPENPDPHRSLAQVYRDTGRFQESAKHFALSMDLQPGDDQTLIDFASVKIELGEFATAAQVCREVLASSPTNEQAHLTLANALVGLGQEEDAARHCRLALNANPRNALAHATLAQLSSRHDLDQALRHMQQALSIEPKSAELHLGLGNLVATAFPLRAIPHFQTALSLRPHYPEAHFNLANALVSVGRFKEALPHLEAAVRLQPDWPEARENLELLTKHISMNES